MLQDERWERGVVRSYIHTQVLERMETQRFHETRTEPGRGRENRAKRNRTTRREYERGRELEREGERERKCYISEREMCQFLGALQDFLFFLLFRASPMPGFMTSISKFIGL